MKVNADLLEVDVTLGEFVILEEILNKYPKKITFLLVLCLLLVSCCHDDDLGFLLWGCCCVDVSDV